MCHTLIAATTRNRKYCATCRRIKQRQQNTDWQRRRRAERGAYHARKVGRPRCGISASSRSLKVEEWWPRLYAAALVHNWREVMIVALEMGCSCGDAVALTELLKMGVPSDGSRTDLAR
jgi:hypothetical protein